MTMQDMHVCIFKPSRCDGVPTHRRLSAHLETPNPEGQGNHVPFSLVLTAWALLLKFYLATDLVSFASCGIGNAEDDEQGDVFQHLIHSLEISDDDTISDAVGRVQAPATQRPFDPALLPCINTMLVRRKVTDAAPETARQMDVCLSVTSSRGVLSMDMELCATKFSQPLAHRLLRTYHHILALVSNASPSQTAASIDPLTGQDLADICEWNAHVPRRRDACLHGIFEEHARSRSRAPAVCSWDGDLTYAELDALSTRLAHKLARLGVGPEVLVPYAFEKSLYAVVSTLAVLKAGGAFVPVDASQPRDRLESIISRVGASLILASPTTAPAFEGLLLTVLVVDGPLLAGLPEQEHNPCSGVGPDNSAFVLFTSGSTGEPKGVVQEHASACTVNEAYGESLFVDAASRVLNFAAYTFDVSTVDVFNTLFHGGCVCIPSEDDRLNDLVRVINEFRVNWVDLTPSFAMASMPRPGDVPTLKTLVLAGEEVKREHVAHFTGTMRVINCYGPAEAGGCLANVYHGAPSQPQTVGVALKSARCWIVDLKSPRRLAPIGAVGELVVEGPALARGYLEDPSKTDAAFFRFPGWRPGETRLARFYRTGDVVRYRPDGMIDFVGRRDTQVKIRGQRVELTEIEQLLSGDNAVKGCLVEFPQSGVYAKRLVGLVEPRLGHGPLPPLELLPAQVLLESGFSLSETTKALAKRVPAYMMPATWLVVTSLPLTESKKVDRRRVRLWLAGLPVSDLEAVPVIPPANTLALDIGHKVGEMIANGNSQVLAALDRRNLDLGAVDSIQAMTLSKWIRDRYGLRLSVDKLTRPGLTVDELARAVAAFRDGQGAEKLQGLDILDDRRLDILDEVYMLSRAFSGKSPIHRRSPAAPVSTVLLTGGTGFLGIEILHQLVCNDAITKVFVLVRTTSVQHGRARIVAAATRAAWWSPSFHDRVEVWPGDLARVKLGLSDRQWDRVTGNSGAPIDAVIHNGAAVRWTLGYQSLKGQNTISTLQLLEAMAARPSGGRFVYVSGGQVLSAGDDDENLMAAQGAHRTGYAQTKVVSELLVKRFSESQGGRGHVVRVVKPSYIIGDAQRGMANQGDYLWALTKSVIELGAYSRDGRDGWLFASDVASVARAVCLCSSETPSEQTDTPPQTVVKMLDGLVMRDFWNVLTRDFGYGLEAVDGAEWWRLLRAHVERAGSRHCLWALQDILAAEAGEIASTATVPTAAMAATSAGMRRAVRSNVRYLRHVRFLPSDGLGQGNRGGWVDVMSGHVSRCLASVSALLSRN